MNERGYSWLGLGGPATVSRFDSLIVACRYVAALAVSNLWASGTVHAQVVRGLATEVVSRAPVVGAVFTFTPVSGGPSRHVVSDSIGHFTIRLGGPGSYRVEAKRIGLRPTELTVPNLAADESRELVVAFSMLPALQPVVAIARDRSCTQVSAFGEAIANLWSDARAALIAVQVGLDEKRLQTEITTFEREVDAKSMAVRTDRRRTVTTTTARPFASVSVEDLERRGYVIAREPDQTVYRAPDAAVLLSNEFARDHCFTLVASREHDDVGPARESPNHEDEVGLAFVPTADRHVPEINGVIWLDRATHKLRDVGFSYTTFTGAEGVRGLGGRVEFQNLASGNWIVSRWNLRIPSTRTYDESYDPSGRDPSLRRQRTVLLGISEIGGEARVVDASNGSAPRNTSSGRITGLAFDSTSSLPLRNAEVIVRGTAMKTATGSDGHFVLEGVPAGLYHVAVAHPRLDRLGLPDIDREVRVVPNATADVTLAAPSWRSAIAQLCAAFKSAVSVDGKAVNAADHLGPSVGVLRGSVLNPSGLAMSSAAVEIRWTAFVRDPASLALGERNMRATTVADSLGRYAVCGIPSDHPLTLRAASASDPRSIVATDTFHISKDSIMVRDVVFAGRPP